MSIVIKAENVDLWYDRGKPMEVKALKGINMEIEKGDYAAFFGPSGCGKTTMLYAIAGIDRYQGGKITINGRDMTGLSNKELAIFRQTGIGIIFQQFNLVPSLTVLQNISLPMAFLGISAEKGEKEARTLLDRLGLTPYAGRYPFELSGGQQQRVGIARALANDPPIIVADEPLGNLDSENANNVLKFLKELNEKDGRTIIMVTHEAWSLRDVKTIFYMKDGAVTGVEKQSPRTIAEALSDHLKKQLSVASGGKGDTTPNAELSSRALSMFLMRGYSLDEVKRFEGLLNSRITGDIDAAEFRKSIDEPFKDGGVGLWTGKAIRISKQVEGIIGELHDIEAVKKTIDEHPEMPIMDEVRHIRGWLTSEYKGKLSDFQRASLEQIISDLIRSSITLDKFKELLKRSKNEYGVGLSFRTAEQFTEKMRLLFAGEKGVMDTLSIVS